MKPGKIFIVAILVLFIGTVGYQIYKFSGRRNMARAEWEAMQQKLEAAQAEHARLAKDIDYYAHPENLEKELRARFNYKKPGESMIIIVPTTSTATLPSSQ